MISFEATDSKHLDDYYVVSMDKYRILKIAYILGGNASGKSNILKAFSMFPMLLLQPCENKNSKIEYSRFALDKNAAQELSVMKINFICEKKKYCYEVHFNNDIVKQESLTAHPFGELRAHKVYERTLNTDTMVSTIKWGEKYRSQANTRNLTINLLPNRTLFGSYQNSNVDIPWMKAIVDWASSYILPVVNTSDQKLAAYTSQLVDTKSISHGQVAGLLTQADIGVSDFKLDRKNADDFDSKELTVRMYHKGSQDDVLFDYSEESSGTQRYYELASVLLQLTKESHFVTVDELENKLHPDLYQHFINTYLLNAKQSQLVFTTHMREFLSDTNLYRDDAVWLAEKNLQGETKVYSLADFDTSVLRNGTSRYNAYRSGRLGAVPRLGDTFIDNITNSKDNG